MAPTSSWQTVTKPPRNSQGFQVYIYDGIRPIDQMEQEISLIKNKRRQRGSSKRRMENMNEVHRNTVPLTNLKKGSASCQNMAALVDQLQETVVDTKGDEENTQNPNSSDGSIGTKKKKLNVHNEGNVLSPNTTNSNQSKKKKHRKYNNLSHRNCNGATNWQKFLSESNVEKMLNSTAPKILPSSQCKGITKKPDPNSGIKSTATKLSKVVGIDCEMVGVGEDGRESKLARVSIVNMNGDCIYDKFVKPGETVTDYRTYVSGIRPEDLDGAEEFSVVQKQVADIVKDRIIVGHALKNDLAVLYLKHSKHLLRDTARFFRRRGERTPSLKTLAHEYLNVTIQEGEHSSVQDAKAAVLLYKLYRKEWEYGTGNKWNVHIDLVRRRMNNNIEEL